MPQTAVHRLHTDVVPFFEDYGVPIKTVLSDNGHEFCGQPDRHPYEPFLQLEGIEHCKTKVRRAQSNGIVERFHRTLLNGHFYVEGRRRWFETIEQMQDALDAYLFTHNTARPHQGRGNCQATTVSIQTVPVTGSLTGGTSLMAHPAEAWWISEQVGHARKIRLPHVD